jgi:hypothetical protein
MTDPRSRAAVAVAERFADGEATPAELAAAREAARAAQAAALASATGTPGIAEVGRATRDRARAGRAATGATRANAADAAWDAGVAAAEAAWYATPAGDRAATRKRQCDLLRDVFGNPSVLPPPLPFAVLTWNGRLVIRLASAIYRDRCWGDLPILADALLDAGCDDEGLLTHLRSEGPHVRGCYALDRILGKG